MIRTGDKGVEQAVRFADIFIIIDRFRMRNLFPKADDVLFSFFDLCIRSIMRRIFDKASAVVRKQPELILQRIMLNGGIIADLFGFNAVIVEVFAESIALQESAVVLRMIVMCNYTYIFLHFSYTFK